jgi:DNA-binding CsgD family transcriptional regulator
MNIYNFFSNRTIIKKVFDKLVGNSDFTVEHQVLNASIILIAINYLYAIPQDLCNGMSVKIVMINGLALIVFLALYYFSRIKKKEKSITVLFFAIIFISLSLDWFPNGGLSGCMPSFYLVLLAYIIILNQGLKRKVLTIIFAINVAVLLVLEYQFPQLISHYTDKTQELNDTLASWIASMIMIGFLVLTSNKLYIHEKLNAISVIQEYRKSSEYLKEQMNKKMEVLSIREREIFRLIIEGKSNKEIAATLFISDLTVKKHITSLFKKIGAKKRLELLDFKA